VLERFLVFFSFVFFFWCDVWNSAMLLKIAGLLFLVVVTSARPKELKGVGAEAANRSDLKRRQQMHRMQQRSKDFHHLAPIRESSTKTTTTTTQATTTQRGQPPVAGVMEGKKQTLTSAPRVPAGTNSGNADEEEGVSKLYDPAEGVVDFKEVTPSLKETASWADMEWQGDKYCQRNSLGQYRFARSYWQSQTDRKGLTMVKFRCEVPSETQDCTTEDNCALIQSGISVPNAVSREEEMKCPHPRQFITGVNATFGGPSLGITSLSIICKVPDWSATTEGKLHQTEPESRHVHMTNRGWEIWVQEAEHNRWETGADVECPPRTAVCAINSKTNWRSGIDIFTFYCCTFPADAYASASASGFKQEN